LRKELYQTSQKKERERRNYNKKMFQLEMNQPAPQKMHRVPKLPEVPIVAPYTWYQHQIDFLQFMHKRETEPIHGMRGGAGCLEMGLGKTMAVYSYLLWKPHPTPALLICEKSIQLELLHEAHKFFAQTLKVLSWYNGMPNPAHGYQGQSYHVFLCTYDQVLGWAKKQDKDPIAKSFMEKEWSRIFLDESQRLASPTTKTHQILSSLQCQGLRMCISGTPILNSPKDLWSQLRFCGLDLSYVQWKAFRSDLESQCVFWKQWSDCTDVHTISIKETTIETPLQPHEKALYNVLLHWLQKRTQKYDEEHHVGRFRAVHIMQAENVLQQACVTPWSVLDHLSLLEKDQDLMDGISIPQKFPWLYTHAPTQFQGACTKYKCLLEFLAYLRKVSPQASKLLLYTQYPGILKRLTELLTVHSIRFERLDENAAMALNRFRTNPSIQVLLSTYNASKGLNLELCQHVLLLDVSRNEEHVNQAIHRVKRLSQEAKTVHIWRFRVPNSIETMMKTMAERKSKKAHGQS
jgi:SNF2 family DNA or RNA helicase